LYPRVVQGVFDGVGSELREVLIGVPSKLSHPDTYDHGSGHEARSQRTK